ncbi:MAG TPA: hypothetical protein ENN80_07870 [Candidatus Hydrogenedentes bacterium]|nr:hypothetical protein [Candidatus Hydrogenedentota bacterium]
MFWALCSAIPVLLAGASGELPAFPRVQVVPLPLCQFAFEVEGVEVLRYHCDDCVSKPYIFPLIGPAGRPVVRMGHPHDPHGHRHHLGIWVGHRDVNGSDFWSEGGGTRVAHVRVEEVRDGRDSASLMVCNRWVDAAGKALMDEKRTVTLHALEHGERYLDVALVLAPADGGVVLGKTPFGFLGVRVAKTMSANDGGGTIRNSEGAVNEEAVLWKRARWVDYTGRATPDEDNGIALFDHPDNPGHPTYFHVRGDGWMGASFCFEAPCTLAEGETLELRYRLYVHGPNTLPESIEKHWALFRNAP